MPNRPHSHKTQQGEVRLRHRSGSHMDTAIAARAATKTGYPHFPIFGPLPFRGDSLETKKGTGEVGFTMHITSYSLTLTLSNKPNKAGEVK